MGTLLAALGNSADSLDVLQRALGVIQANVSHSSTPGYATQRLNLVALPMDSVTTTGGQLGTSGMVSSRDASADSAVELQLQALGLYSTQNTATGTIQNFFDVTGSTGVSAALTKLFTAFSAWSAAPSDSSARQAVLTAADAVAADVGGLATSLQRNSNQVGQQTATTVDQINSLAAQIRQYNVTRESNGQADPGADAQLQTNLESLAKLVNFTALRQANGTVTVLAGTGTPLVMGDQQYLLSASQSVTLVPVPVNPLSPPNSHIFDSQGKEITGSMTGGQLGGLLETQNRVLAGIIGDSQNAGSLNLLAKGLADTVNQILQSGTVSSAAGAAAGVPLFTYDASDATAAAASLQVSSTITTAQLAPADAAGIENGNAVALAALANPSGVQGTINGLSYTAFFASIAAGVGSENATAQNNQQAQQSVVTQAKQLRDSISGVSLDAQAALLLQFQRAYQSVSRVLTVINSLADSALSIIPHV